MSSDNETTTRPPVGGSAAHAIYNAALAEAMDSAKQKSTTSNDSTSKKNMGSASDGDDEMYVEVDHVKKKVNCEKSNGAAKKQDSSKTNDTAMSDSSAPSKTGGERDMANKANDKAVNVNAPKLNRLSNMLMPHEGDSGEMEPDEQMEAMSSKLQDAWQFTIGDHDPEEADALFQTAYNATLEIVGEMLDSIIQDGLHAYNQMEHGARELQLAKETIESKDQELQRLRASDESQRKTISNLLRAVEKGKADAKETSQVALVEARMRGEIVTITKEKDEALASVEETKRKVKLLQDELRQTKTKLTKAEQDKVKLERDRRATMSWAKSVDTHMSSDCDFYKRKVTELNTHIQGLKRRLDLKDSAIDDMRRQLERSMSNNRMANLRATQTEHGFKKARKSY